MKQIRKSVFETNSSSTHSICITKNDILDSQVVNNIYFELGEFGWEICTLDTINDKASYLYTAIVYNDKLELIESIKRILDKNNVNCEFEELEDDDYCYIDHGYKLNKFIDDICNNEDKLMRFLFSSESFVLTGNDNDDHDVDIIVDYEHDEYYKGN